MMLQGLLHVSFFWSQIFGAACFVLDFIRFRQTGRKQILLWGIPVGLALVISQMFNAQYQGASMSGASMVSSVVQSPFGRNSVRHKSLRLFIGLVFGAIGLWCSPPGIVWVTWLPLTGYLVGRAGELTHNFIHLRLVWLVSTTIFMIYHFLMENWMAGLTEVLVLVMSIHFLYQHFSIGA